MVNESKLMITICTIIIITYSCTNTKKYLSDQEVYVECDKKGFVPRPTKSYKKYKKFLKTAKVQELYELSESKNLALRTYANWGLIEKLDTGYIDVFEKLLQDTTEIFYGCGCTSRSERISTTTYYNYFTSKDNLIDSEGKPLESLHSDEKLYKLDSVIIFSDVEKDKLLWDALLYRKLNSKILLDRVYRLAFEEDNLASANYIKENFDDHLFKVYKEQILILDPDNLSDFGKQLLMELTGTNN